MKQSFIRQKNWFFKQLLITSLIAAVIFSFIPVAPAYAAGSSPLPPSNLKASLLGSGYVNLTWDPVYGASYYVVEGTIKGEKVSFIPTAGKTSFLVPYFLENGSSFSFRVMTEVSTYSFSDYSPSITITKPANFFGIFRPSPVAPSSLTTTIQSDGSIQMNWQDNATDETGYYYSDYDGKHTIVSQLPANTTTKNVSWQDDTLTSQLKVCALGTSNVSAWAEITTEHPNCKTPSNLTALKDSDGRVTLNWTDNSNNELGFQIQTSDNDWFIDPVEISANTTTYVDTRPKVAGYTYRYKVNSVSPYVYYNHNTSNEVSVYFATGFAGGLAPPTAPTEPPTGITPPAVIVPPVIIPVPLTQPAIILPLVDYSSASSWAIPEIKKAIGFNLTTDKVLGSFTQKITREQFCEIAVKLYEAVSGETVAAASANPFTDTTNSEILKAYKLGIVKGITTSTFVPGNSITRQEICVMLLRALKAAEPDENYVLTASPTIMDAAQIAPWALDSVKYMNNAGIMNGTGGNMINPLGNTTIEQAIALITRMYTKVI